MSRVLEDEEQPAASALPAGPEDRPAGRVQRLLPLCVWIAIVGFVVVGIGWPLLGQSVFGPTDLLARWSPYGETVLAGVVPRNTFLQDVADGVLPQTALFVDLFLNGNGGAWNPYMVGGTPLGAVPNNAFFSPLSLPFYLLPVWFAPAWVKVLEIAVSVGGTFLFARRLGLSRAAALTGGLVFASSAFMIAWTGWTQTRTAAFIPVLFWAIERLVQRRRVSDGVLVCLAAAAMLFGGFPAITGYALAAGGVYFLMRVLAEYPQHWKRILTVAAGGIAAIVGAVSLAAVQLLPFQYFMSHAYVFGRDQTAADTIPLRSLITAVAPWALGSTDPLRPPPWFAGTNLVEAVSYVGAAALLLALVALAAVRTGRGMLPRGVWIYLVAAIGVLVVLMYAGGPPLAIAQQLPVLFAENFVGRARSVLGFLIAVLAAVGFELLLRQVRQRDGVLRRLWGPAVWVGAAAGTVALWYVARTLADNAPNRLDNFDEQVFIGLAFVVVAAGCVALAWWARGRAVRTIALLAVPLLISVQALTFAVPYWVRSDRDTFYPETRTHEYLAEHLGNGRYASPVNTLLPGESSVHELRSLGGHAFSDKRMGELIEALPGGQYRDPPTLPSIAEDPAIVGSPILDRLSVRYYVAAPSAPVIGTPHDLETDGPSVQVPPGTTLTARLQQNGPLRAVAAHIAAPIPSFARLEVSVRDPDGQEVATGARNLRPTSQPLDLQIPVAGESIPPGTPLHATLSLHGDDLHRDDPLADHPLVLAGQNGQVALTTIGPAEDGLELVMADPSVIYARDNALPRIRWAGTAVVEPDQDTRLAMLAAGDIGPGEVLLDDVQPDDAQTAGTKATIDVVEDGTEDIEAVVRSDGPGYLVVADALQHGWQVAVDGEPAELLAADHGMVAVAVGAGEHTVRYSYASPYSGAGTWLSAATAVLLCALVVVERWWRRRQKPMTHTDG